MFASLFHNLEVPELYRATEGAFWDDEHISLQMLRAHLDPEFEGASRKLAFIERSAAWIRETLPPAAYPRLLDFGCGPGLYAERFARAEFQVTGVDLSRRSVTYAQNSARQQGLAIRYLLQNYLAMTLDETFDLATMIYCDYGALSAADRKLLLQNVYRHLRPKGRFLFDVFSVRHYEAFAEGQTWDFHPDGGFWRDRAHLELHARRKYPGSVTLEQTVILEESGTSAYYLWNTCYSAETLAEEVQAAGFKVCQIFSDVAGRPYDPASPTLAVLVEK